MSVDVIREMNEAVDRGDVERFAQSVHPDAVWEHNPGGGSPEEGVYEGREQIRQLFERILEGWDYIRLAMADLSETGSGAYLARGEMHFKHPNMEAEIVEPYEQRLEFDDGLLSKGRMVFGR